MPKKSSPDNAAVTQDISILSSPILASWINPKYLQSEQFSTLKHKFANNKPFKHLQAEEFFLHHRLVEVLKALLQEKFYFKESDLFKFNQTQDLKSSENKTITDFVAFLYSKDFLIYMENLTGFKFSKTVDIAGTLYEDTNFLLCHDDQCDNRKIAFLTYLSSVEEGGALALYDNLDNAPNNIIERIIPEFNKLAFFEVSPISFHEVEEVIGQDEKRLAIGGWYYE